MSYIVHDKYKESFLHLIPVFITIIIAQKTELINSLWACVSAYIVYKKTFQLSVEKACLRIVGTVFGALLGYSIASLFVPNKLIVCILVFIFTIYSIYNNNTTNYGYALVYFSMTIFIVLSRSIHELPTDLKNYVIIRIFSVLFGSCIALIFNSIFGRISETKEFFIKIKDFKNIEHYFYEGLIIEDKEYKSDLIFYCLCGAVALSTTVLFNPNANSEIFFQSGTSILFIMILPFKTIKDKGINAMYTRILHRLAGALIGACIGMICFLVVKSNSLLFYPAVIVSIFACILVNYTEKYSYIGLQTFLGYSSVMFPKPMYNYTYIQIFTRFIGVFEGVLVLLCCIFILSLLRNLYRKSFKTT